MATQRVIEQRCLIAVTIGCAFSIIFWLVSISTPHWCSFTAPGEGIYMNKTKIVFIRSHAGLWRLCRTISRNGTTTEHCRNVRMFPSQDEINRDPELDKQVIEYSRTQAIFSVVTVLLMIMGLGFSMYTFKQPRYTYKRLVGGIHFFTACAVLVVIEVFINALYYEDKYAHGRYPKNIPWKYGYSIIIAWITFAFYVVAGIVFVACSRKRKDGKGDDIGGTGDEPQIIGRL